MFKKIKNLEYSFATNIQFECFWFSFNIPVDLLYYQSIITSNTPNIYNFCVYLRPIFLLLKSTIKTRYTNSKNCNFFFLQTANLDASTRLNIYMFVFLQISNCKREDFALFHLFHNFLFLFFFFGKFCIQK